MRKIFVILFCLIMSSVFAEEVHRITDNTTDLRNKLWYYGSNSMDDINIFVTKFGKRYVERYIVKDRLNDLQEPYRTICINLLNRGRAVALPGNTYRTMTICDDRYGVMLLWWNDVSSFGGQDPQERLMFRHFFELKPVSR